LFKLANADERVKIVIVHGGPSFSAGNDLGKMFKAFDNPEKAIADAHETVLNGMVNFLTALVDLEKPIIAVVSGACVGISCTMLGFFDFIYSTPSGYFKTPFMQSF